jgi:hypothetical protein
LAWFDPTQKLEKGSSQWKSRLMVEVREAQARICGIPVLHETA